MKYFFLIASLIIIFNHNASFAQSDALMKDFQIFKKTRSDEQIKEIQEYIRLNYDSLFKPQSISYNFDEINRINNKWISENDKEKYAKWNQLSFLRTELKEKVKRYNEIIDLISKVDDKIDSIGTEIKRLSDEKEKMVQSEGGFESILILNKKLDNLKSQYMADLQMIPQYILLIGKAEIPNSNSSEQNNEIISSVKKVLQGNMERFAIKELNYTDAFQHFIKQKDELLSVFKEKKTGHCRVDDSYFEIPTKYNLQTQKNNLFKIQIFEVFPFYFAAGKPNDNDLKDEDAKLSDFCKIFAYSDSSSEESLKTFSYNAFRINEIAYINAKNEIVNYRNNESENFLNTLKETYANEENCIINRISEIANDTTAIATKIAIERTRRDSLNEVSKLLSQHLGTEKENLGIISNKYKKFIDDDFIVINQLAKAKLGESTPVNRCTELVEPCFKNVKDFSAISSKNVFLEIVSEKDKYSKIIQEEKSIKPKIEAFKIISLNLYGNNEEDGDRIILNIAFKLKNILTSPVDEKYLPKYLKTNSGCWRFYDDRYASVETYNPEDGWRIPNKEEFLSFLDDIALANSSFGQNSLANMANGISNAEAKKFFINWIEKGYELPIPYGDVFINNEEKSINALFLDKDLNIKEEKIIDQGESFVIVEFNKECSCQQSN